MYNSQSVELDFKQQLQYYHTDKRQNSVLISNTDYFNIILDLKNADNLKTKNPQCPQCPPPLQWLFSVPQSLIPICILLHSSLTETTEKTSLFIKV